MKTLLLMVALALTLPVAGRADEIDDIYQSIQRGKWRAAADRLAEMKEVNSNGSLLFLHGLLERSGDRAAQFFETALERSVAVKYQEEIYFRLTQYYLQKDNLAKVSLLANEYRTRFEKGKYRAAMARYRILAEEMNGDHRTAFSLNEQYLKNNGKGEWADWGKIDRARILLGSNGDQDGVDLFRQLSMGSSAIAVPQAMVLLGQYHVEKRETENAMRCYELLKEEYPSAIGLDDLANRLGKPSLPVKAEKSPKTSSRTEQIAPSAKGYTIQVGAFSTEKIAKEQIERLRKERLATRIEKKESDGRTLWVVFIGQYKDSREADQARLKLQKRYGETYEVVPR